MSDERHGALARGCHSLRVMLAVGVGVAGALCAVGVNRVPAGWRTVGASVDIAVHRSGPFEVIPTGSVVTVADLQAGQHATGSTNVRNLTERTQALQVRLSGSRNNLDHVLGIEIEVNGRAIAHGPLGRLRVLSQRRVYLRPGQVVTVTIRASLGNDPAASSRGAVLNTQLELTPASPS